MGSFYPPKSDIDLLVIVDELSEREGRILYERLAHHHDCRPYAGGLEVSIIRRRDAQYPKHPVPSLLHFSETTRGFQEYRDGNPPTDGDLIAHLMVARQRGVSLLGPRPEIAIGDLCWTDYLSSVRADIDWILEDENLLTSPYYGVLNLCRWAMMQAGPQGLVPSKEEAGVWALSHLPAFTREVVSQALAACRAPDWPGTIVGRQTAGGPWARSSLIDFRNAMRARI